MLRYNELQSDFASAAETHEKEIQQIISENVQLKTEQSHCTNEIERLNGLLAVLEKDDVTAVAQELR